MMRLFQKENPAMTDGLSQKKALVSASGFHNCNRGNDLAG